MTAPRFAIGDRVTHRSTSTMLISEYGWHSDRQPDVAELVGVVTVVDVGELYGHTIYGVRDGTGGVLVACERELSGLEVSEPMALVVASDERDEGEVAGRVERTEAVAA